MTNATRTYENSSASKAPEKMPATQITATESTKSQGTGPQARLAVKSEGRPETKSGIALAYRRSADGGPLLATPEDVNLAYNTFLGREPESPEVVANATGQPIDSIIHEMLSSIEFQDIATRLSRSPDEVDERGFAPGPLGVWLLRQLVAPSAFGEVVAACNTWRDMIIRLLDAELFAGSVPAIGYRPFSSLVRFAHQQTEPSVSHDTQISASPGVQRLTLEELKQRINAGRLFDARWYVAKYRLQIAHPDEALEHFLAQGSSEGHEPNPLFNSDYYRTSYLQEMTDEPAFFNYLRIGIERDFSPNPLISAVWVKKQLERHKLADGVLSAVLHKSSALLLDPHPCFSVRFYLRRYPELRMRRAHPLVHYLQDGGRERRTPHPLFWPEYFAQLAGAELGANNPLVAYLYKPNLFAIAPNPYFDPQYYLNSQPEIRSKVINPLQHYLENAQVSIHSPNPSLDLGWAREQYRIQLVTLGMDPLSFLLTHANGFVFGNPKSRVLSVNGGAAHKNTKEMQDKAFGIVAAVPRRRRLVYLSHNLKIQGAQTSLFELARGMARDPFNDVTVLAPDDGPMKQRYEGAGIPVVKYMLPVAGMADEARYGKLLQAFRAQIKQLGPDLLHGNTIQAYHAIASAAEQGIPTVWNIRESEEPSSHFAGLTSGAQSLLGRAIESPTEFIFVSRTTQSVWLHAYPSLSSSAINNGINYNNLLAHSRDVGRPVARALFGLQDGEIMIFNVGTWTERKGQRDIVHAMRLVNRRLWPRLRVVLIGANESDYTRQLMAELEELPRALRDRFSIRRESASPAERAIVTSAYHAADIFTFTSRIESYPRVINEALYFGLPIISTPCFGVVEQIEPGVSGLFYEAGEIAKLAHHIEVLAVSLAQRKKMAEKARYAAFNRVTQYDSMLASYDTVYRRVIQA